MRAARTSNGKLKEGFATEKDVCSTLTLSKQQAVRMELIFCCAACIHSNVLLLPLTTKKNNKHIVEVYLMLLWNSDMCYVCCPGILFFFASFFSLLVSLCKAMVVMHIIITITIDRPSTYQTPSIWWKKFRYSILFRQSP